MISTPKMIPYRVSKWLSLPMLIDEQELVDLLQSISPKIYLSGCVLTPGEQEVSHEKFLRVYADYVMALREGRLLDEGKHQRHFSSVWTLSDEAVYAIEVQEDQWIVKPKLPVIQLQMHRLGYSALDGKIRSMALGPDTMSWGIQFSYPQIYQDPQSDAALDGKSFENWQLYRGLQQWARKQTIPTPFMVSGERVNHPVRLGKRCLGWINQHPQIGELCIEQR